MGRRPTRLSEVSRWLCDLVLFDCRLADHQALRANVRLLDGGGTTLVRAASTHDEGVLSPDLPVGSPALSATAHRAWESVFRRPLVESLSQLDSHQAEDEWLRRSRSFAVVPLMRGGDCIGTLSVHAAEPVQLLEGHQGVLSLAAAILSYVVDAGASSVRRPSPVSSQLGASLKVVRQDQGLSQKALADRLGRARLTISRWEGGAQPPSLGPLYEWCQALGIVEPESPCIVKALDISLSLLPLLREDPIRLHNLSPEQFEHFVAEHLTRMGYNVTLTGRSSAPDGGIDLVAARHIPGCGPFLVAGQMKHHRTGRTTGDGAVRDLLSWKDRGFHLGLLVTNTEFTRNALWRAQEERNRAFLRLRDFDDLKRWLEDNFWSEEDWIQIPDEVEVAPGVRIAIPKPRLDNWREIWPDAAIEIRDLRERG